MSIIKSLWNYFYKCPLTKDFKINVNYLPNGENGVEFSIDPCPSTLVIEEYADGSVKKQYAFNVRSINAYGFDVWEEIESLEFFENLAEWLEKQTDEGNFPDLGKNKEAINLKAETSGYIQGVDPGTAVYVIQCKLDYIKMRKGD